MYPPQTDYSLILYWSNGNHNQNIHYPWSCDIWFSTAWYILVYEATYKTLGLTHPGISTTSNVGRKSSHNKGMELERYSLLTLIGVNPEISLETHEKVHTKNQQKPGHGHMR